MNSNDLRPLLDSAHQHLGRYITLLLESRSGAASDREQEAAAVQKLLRAIEQINVGSPDRIRPH